MQRAARKERAKQGHPPPGGCGLKFFRQLLYSGGCLSPSTRRVWIEIINFRKACQPVLSPSARRVWIEIGSLVISISTSGSPSARRVWIEIPVVISVILNQAPSPSARRVWIEISLSVLESEASACHPPPGGCGLKSGEYARYKVDYGHPPPGGCGLKFEVAVVYDNAGASPSARRVWIEILRWRTVNGVRWSPSIRRVWIEIRRTLQKHLRLYVTLRPEGVD